MNLDLSSHSPQSGRVALVGAGPGDPELLTLKAVRLISEADVILVDDLVNPAILQHARASARIVYVGKRGGCQSTPQAFIERLMIMEAQAGRFVVRLKGGDPFMFGRGGEERAHLLEQGIAVEIVNGISSGMAAPTTLGIPLTHRDYAHGAIFVTGHGKTEDAKVDWSTLARTGMTLVIYMGVARAAQIEQGLLQGGLAAATPVALIQHASLPQQYTVLTSLEALSTTIATQKIGSPCIMVIGEVVRCAELAKAMSEMNVTKTA